MNPPPHAIERAKERLDIDIDIPTLNEWCRLIRTGRARFVAPQREGCGLWVVTHADLAVPVIFDPNARHGLGSIVTVLGPTALGRPRVKFADPSWRDRRRQLSRARWMRIFGDTTCGGKA